MTRILTAALAFAWAGLSLGGNLIAAPAKFQVADLTMQVALQVGRAQFTWLGYAEWVFLGLILVIAILSKFATLIIFLIPTTLFLTQQFVLMPMLNSRSDIVIAGGAPPESSLHLIYILFELAKCTSLAVGGILLISKEKRT